MNKTTDQEIKELEEQITEEEEKQQVLRTAIKLMKEKEDKKEKQELLDKIKN